MDIEWTMNIQSAQCDSAQGSVYRGGRYAHSFRFVLQRLHLGLISHSFWFLPLLCGCWCGISTDCLITPRGMSPPSHAPSWPLMLSFLSSLLRSLWGWGLHYPTRCSGSSGSFGSAMRSSLPGARQVQLHYFFTSPNTFVRFFDLMVLSRPRWCLLWHSTWMLAASLDFDLPFSGHILPSWIPPLFLFF